MIHVVQHEQQGWEQWRPGVLTRAWTGASLGSRQVHMGEQLIAPECEAPRHWHYYEEIVTILNGKVELTVDDETILLEGPVTAVFPALSRHGFKNVGNSELHVVGAIPWPMHETYFVDGEDGLFVREYERVVGGKRRWIGEVGPPAR
jgi:quercetin dioxygenase-like cupin family protein